MATDRGRGIQGRAGRQPPHLIFDSGVLIGLSRADPRAIGALQTAHRLGRAMWVPAVVLAETLRGDARDAPVHRALRLVRRVIPADERVGATAGALLGSVGGSATIDALVVASAVAIGGGTVLTVDLGDLRPLAEAAGPTISVLGL